MDFGSLLVEARLEKYLGCARGKPLTTSKFPRRVTREKGKEKKTLEEARPLRSIVIREPL
jgi:hypothetical protein